MPTKELSSPPGFATLYPKAVFGTVAAPARRVPVLGSLVGGGSKDLPDTELVLPEVEIDREHLTEYNRLCGFASSDEVPATYPHNLVFRLAMELMTDRSFPFPIIGMVHIENRIELLRPLRVVDRLTMRARAEDLRPHDKGTQFDIAAEASVGEEPVWRSRTTYLRREGGSDGSRKKDGHQPPKPDGVWEVPGDIGRRFAAISGDRNPIHMHPLAGRAFGFPGAIAHGMWVKARCLAELEDELPDAPYTVEVRFKAPLKIPARVEFATWEEDNTRAFAVHEEKSGKPHLTGELQPTPE